MNIMYKLSTKYYRKIHRGGIKMAQLNQLELQNLRHLIGGHQTISVKLNTYAQQCQDPQIKQLFQQASTAASQTAQQLMGFLQ